MEKDRNCHNISRVYTANRIETKEKEKKNIQKSSTLILFRFIFFVSSSYPNLCGMAHYCWYCYSPLLIGDGDDNDDVDDAIVVVAVVTLHRRDFYYYFFFGRRVMKFRHKKARLLASRCRRLRKAFFAISRTKYHDTFARQGWMYIFEWGWKEMKICQLMQKWEARCVCG